MKILVVDDDLIMLGAMETVLSCHGYKVITAKDGMKAIEIIENQELDLIISDIMMPNLSGISLLSILKQFYFNRIPVILISSLDKTDVILSYVNLGANDFIAKPINFDELLIKVQKFAS